MKYTPDFSSRFRILKGGKISLVVSALVAGSTMSFASPTGGQVTSGSATINQSGSVTTINQSTNKASINWNSFSIAPSETVNFVQPSSQSVTLNRVIGATPSLIQGAMNANGQVFLINPNGVLFSNGAQINVGGLVASTLNLTDENFQAGNYVFEGNSQNSIINMGTITASNGGYVAMMGKTVANEGTIVATMGNVQMASGEKVSLNLNGNSLVKLTIDQGTMDALVENKGLIQADGGQVYLTTQALNIILDGMVNNTGIIEAQSIDDLKSEVILFAHGGTATISGTIDATGGFVETSGDKVKINDDFKVKADKWLIDPTDFTIAENAFADMRSSILSASLGGANVEILTTNGWTGTNGDIIVNDAITWTSGNTLTLNAYRNIYINAVIDASGDLGGKIELFYGQGSANGGADDTYMLANGATINLQSGQNFSTRKGSTEGNLKEYTVINGADNDAIATALQNMNNNRSGNYALGANVDLEGKTWTPIGPLWGQPHFSGLFDGLGHTIDNLAINDSTQYRGLFGITASSSVIRNVGLTNVDIIGGLGTGALIGANQGKVYNVYSTGSVKGTAQVGGLIGNNSGTLSQSYSLANVSFVSNDEPNTLGGLVGHNNGVISNSYAAGHVDGTGANTSLIGGFAGNNYGTITNSYFAGTITNGQGGFVAMDSVSGVSNSFWNKQIGMATDISDGTTGLTTAEFADTSHFGTWDSSVWSFTDVLVEGYGIASRPYLKYVPADDTIALVRLFDGGFGTSASPYTITTATQLQNMNNANVVGQRYYYNLENDIDLEGVTWTPIGSVEGTLYFNGVFDGQYNTIDNLTINSTSYTYQGLFGVTYTDSIIKNLVLTNIDLYGGGASGADAIGGLVGFNRSTISGVYVTGNVESLGDRVGGFVGVNQGIISNSYSGVEVIGKNQIGGFVGRNDATIRESYFDGSVTGVNDVGGFVGRHQQAGRISDSYALATVEGTNNVGGFVGDLDTNNNGFIRNSYAASSVLSGGAKGGFAGRIGSTIDVTNSFWDKTTSGIETDNLTSGTTGLTTAQMKTKSIFEDAGWDITGRNGNYPILLMSNMGSTWYIPLLQEPEPTPTPPSTPTTPSSPTTTEEQIKQINNIVTTIVNSTLIPRVPMVITPKAPQQPSLADIQTTRFLQTIMPETNKGESYSLVGTTDGNAAVETVSMEQLQKASSAQAVNEIRVALGQDSFVELVNGGVNLPQGLSQEFYVVNNTNQDKKN